MDLTPRLASLVALVALVPGIAFAVARGESVVAIALVNVVLIFGSLHVAFSPVPGGGHDGDGHDDTGRGGSGRGTSG